MKLYKCIEGFADRFTIGNNYYLMDNNTVTDNSGHVWYGDKYKNAIEWLVDHDAGRFTCYGIVYPTITITTDGRKTTATMTNNGKTKTAFCACHNDDEFNFAVGADIAFKRLFDKNYMRKPINKSCDIEDFKIKDKVEVVNPTYADSFNVEFFNGDYIDYLNHYLFGYKVRENDFGKIIAIKDNLCLISRANMEGIECYILVDKCGLRKL